MKIIGLCGGSGSGKGTVSKLFAELGVQCIDADAVYREITSADSPCLRALTDRYGKSILNTGGGLDRRKLSEIVFLSDNSKNEREALNSITHKFVIDRIDGIISEKEKLGITAFLVDAPLLFESGYNEKCDIIIAVIADEDIRMSRIIERDGISQKEAVARIRSQHSNEYLINNSQYIIFNNTSEILTLKKQVIEIAKEINIIGEL